MSNFLSSGVFALPPKVYGPSRGHAHQGMKETERFSASLPTSDDYIEDYMRQQQPLQPSCHRDALSSSKGLMELHYDTMRKKATFRSQQPTYITTPSMDRSYKACANYSGHIPGKVSGNLVGSSWKTISILAHESTGQHFHPPNSGVTFGLGSRSASSIDLRRTSSFSSLQNTGMELCRPSS